MPCGFACSEETNRLGEPTKRTVYSSTDFDDGRKDGKRDAENSWVDANSTWSWGWMVSEDYLRGYEQGWTEGRARVNLEAQQKTIEEKYEGLKPE